MRTLKIKIIPGLLIRVENNIKTGPDKRPQQKGTTGIKTGTTPIIPPTKVNSIIRTENTATFTRSRTFNLSTINLLCINRYMPQLNETF